MVTNSHYHHAFVFLFFFTFPYTNKWKLPHMSQVLWHSLASWYHQDTFWSEETDKVCRRAVISARLCSNAATRLACRGRHRGRRGQTETEKSGGVERADRYESPAASNRSAASHAHSTSSKWLCPSAGRGGRGWSGGQLWMMSEMKEDVRVMWWWGRAAVWCWGTNLVNLM